MNFHPGVIAVFARLGADELGIARLMAAGDLTSPQRYMNVTLVNLRITGTGLRYRPVYDEYVFRRPEDYLTDDFLARCNGLPVIMNHPKKTLLDSEEYASRNVGSVMLPYIKSDGVWAIARIYDDETSSMFDKEQISTSPAVFLDKSYKLNFDDGKEVLVEDGKPKLLDHIAICKRGVWDEGELPDGVEQTNIRGDSAMAEEKIKGEEDKKADAVRADAEKEKEKGDGKRMDEKFDMLLSRIDSMCSRMDAFEKKEDPKEEKEDKEKKADKRKDAAEMTPDVEAERLAADKRKDAAEKEEDEKKKADAMRADSTATAELVALRAQIDRLTQLVRQPVAEMDRAPLTEAQARADSVMIKFGDRAPIPLAGESAPMYKRRIASALQKHSDRWKGKKIDALDADSFQVVEDQIYADAAERAQRPNDIAPSGMRQVVSREESGHMVTRWYGGPQAHFVKHFTPRAERGWVGTAK